MVLAKIEFNFLGQRRRSLRTADWSRDGAHGHGPSSPLGGGATREDGGYTARRWQAPVVLDIAQAHDRTPAQVILRWHLREGRSVVPKSTNPERIARNFDVFDFELTDDELARIDALDKGVRGGPEREEITLESDAREIPEP